MAVDGFVSGVNNGSKFEPYSVAKPEHYRHAQLFITHFIVIRKSLLGCKFFGYGFINSVTLDDKEPPLGNLIVTPRESSWLERGGANIWPEIVSNVFLPLSECVPVICMMTSAGISFFANPYDCLFAIDLSKQSEVGKHFDGWKFPEKPPLSNQPMDGACMILQNDWQRLGSQFPEFVLMALDARGIGRGCGRSGRDASDGIRIHRVTEPTARIGNFAGATGMQAVNCGRTINVNAEVSLTIRCRVLHFSWAFAVASDFIEPVDSPQNLFRYLLRISKVCVRVWAVG